MAGGQAEEGDLGAPLISLALGRLHPVLLLQPDSMVWRPSVGGLRQHPLDKKA